MTTRGTLELGHKRPDGKYNLWRYQQIGPNPYVLDWVIVRVVDSFKEGVQAIEQMLKPKRHNHRRKEQQA